MPKKQVRTQHIRRSERKNIAVGQAHIKSTFNNTTISITDPQGNVIAWQSGCLLYTSPSPRDVEESRMPSSA